MSRCSEYTSLAAAARAKTTLGRRLAQHLGVPFIDLDVLYWEPGWVEVGHAELARRLAPHLAASGWVVAGNYHATTEVHVWPRATHVLVLDLPYLTLLRRAAWRTVVRGLTGATCCNGNRESVWRLFHHDGVVMYLTRAWRRRHQRYATLHEEAALAHARVVVLQSPEAATAALQALAAAA